MTGSLADVLPSTAARLGVPGCIDVLDLAERLDDARQIVVILVDGLGHQLLARAAPHAPLLAAVLAGQVGSLDELTAPFPSTTPTSLATLGTGTLAGQHGILGFTVNVPGTERVLTHITWRDDPAPLDWQPVPTVFERAAAVGIPSSVVLPRPFEGSGLTIAAYRGAHYAALDRGDDAAARIRSELDSGARLVYGYTAAIDTAAHVFGIASAQWGAAVAKVDGLLQRIAAGLPDDAALLVTADHGGLDIPPGGRLDVADDPRLIESVRVIAGEPRARYLHVRAGTHNDVVATWRGVLGERASVLTRDEAVSAGLFGPVAPAHLPRIGDVVVICTDDATVVLASGHEPPEVAKLIGFHGSTTHAETAIPLIGLRR